MLRSFAWIAVLLLPLRAAAEGLGVDSRQEYPPVGCGGTDGLEVGCHFTEANQDLVVTLVGPTELAADPFGSGSYAVSIPTDFASLEGAGVNVAIAAGNATGCQLEAFSSNLRDANDSLDPEDFVLTHAGNDSPPDNLVGVWGYEFLIVNCTNPGTLTLLAAMNAFNRDGLESGEIWNKTELQVTVPEPAGAALGLAALTALALLERR